MRIPENPRLYLRFLGSLIEELGAKMYPSVTASVAELVSNAWDADAMNVWITMPLGKRVAQGGIDSIVVLDDGIGMSREEAKLKYLVVGRKRRKESAGWTSESGRLLHGRKGVGKLAAFGTAKLLQCTTTTKNGDYTAFKLEYDVIRNLEAGADYEVPEIVNPTPLLRPDTRSRLEQGTEVRLSKLLSKIIPPETSFRQSLARRFGVLSPEMRVFLNGREIERFEIPVDIRFPKDGVPEPGKGLPARDAETGEESKPVIVDDGWAVENLPGGEVRWWIGFTPTPIEAGELRGIAVLAHRKMVQRPFMFGRSQGTAGQLGQEYLVGEVVADWIDDNIQPEDDLVETNRNELQLEDERLQIFLEWGQSRLRWALARRNELRTTRTKKEVFVEPAIQERLEKFTKREQSKFENIGEQLAGLPEVKSADVAGLMADLIDAYDDKSVREMMEKISEEQQPTQQRMWALVAEFGLIDARRTATRVQARMQVIDKLADMIENGAREVPDIHNHLRENTWLLDPRWDLYDDEVYLTKMLHDRYGYAREGEGSIVDYLFAVGPSTPTSADEVIVVEIKRGKNADGSLRRATFDEVVKFSRYVQEADDYYKKANSPSEQPTVKGLMIASGYTAEADSQRRVFDSVPGYRFQFKSWESVLKDSRRLHQFWFDLSSRRARLVE